jgi:glutaredoxin
MHATTEGLRRSPTAAMLSEALAKKQSRSVRGIFQGQCLSSEAVLCRVYKPPSIKIGSTGVKADQKEVVVYARRPSWRWWLTKRLLRRSGYFKVIDATNNSRLCSSPVHYMGRETMPYVYIDHRPVGGLSELKTLERSGTLEHLVRGGV